MSMRAKLAGVMGAGCVVAASGLAQPVIAGFDGTRAGGVGALDTGSGFVQLRDDMIDVVENAEIRTGGFVSPQLLDGVALAVFGVAWAENNVQITPMSEAEQATLRDWVLAGGHALLLTDNALGYLTASDSFVGAYGVTNLAATRSGIQSANVTAAVCGATDGLFGTFTTLRGSWTGAYGDVLPPGATRLASWASGDTAAIYVPVGNGAVIVCADSNLADTVFTSWSPNAALRRNILTGFAGLRVRANIDKDTYCVGQTATITLPGAIAAAGYVWRHDGVPLSDGGNISGSHGPTLTVSGLSAADFGSYDCVMSGACGQAISTAAPLRVCVADVNCDQTIDLSDFFDFFNCFDQSSACADLDGTPGVDLGDFFAFFNAFDTNC